MKQIFIAGGLALVFCAWAVGESTLQSRGELRFESRAFQPDKNILTKDYGSGLAGRLEVTHEHRDLTEKFQIFGRSDHFDQSRSLFLIEEAYAKFEQDQWSLLAGLQILNWSATEAFHPADVINSRNFDSNFENAEKLGEPMVAFNYLTENGSLSLYYMPFLMNPIVPQGSNRLSFVPPGTQIGTPRFVDSDGDFIDSRFAHQYAIRLEQSFEGADLSVHGLRHWSRDQALSRVNGSEVVPVFLPLWQVGGNYQHALGSWVIKLETAYRWWDTINQSTELGTVAQPNHAQSALGLEYGWTHENGLDSTFILEGQYIYGVGRFDAQNLGSLQADALLGYRLAFNDEYSQEIFMSVIADLERRDEFLFNTKWSRRLSDVWGIGSGFRIISSPSPGTLNGFRALDKDNYVFVDLSRYF